MHGVDAWLLPMRASTAATARSLHSRRGPHQDSPCMQKQFGLFDDIRVAPVPPFTKQLLKWVGNKQRFVHEIASYFPAEIGTYFEPFLGSGAVLGTLSPQKAIASDIFRPLMEIWQTLHDNPTLLKQWYAERWQQMASGDKIEEYERIKAAYNARPNGADLLFLCRSCYGGVVRFRQADGYMSTPCGIHTPISPTEFAHRVDEWQRRTAATQFQVMDYQEAMDLARGRASWSTATRPQSQPVKYIVRERGTITDRDA